VLDALGPPVGAGFGLGQALVAPVLAVGGLGQPVTAVASGSTTLGVNLVSNPAIYTAVTLAVIPEAVSIWITPSPLNLGYSYGQKTDAKATATCMVLRGVQANGRSLGASA